MHTMPAARRGGPQSPGRAPQVYLRRRAFFLAFFLPAFFVARFLLAMCSISLNERPVTGP